MAEKTASSSKAVSTEPKASATPQVKKEPMIKSKGVAALVSLFFPGVGLALCNPSRTVEGIVVFLLVLLADFTLFAVAFLGGTIAPVLLGIISQGLCCFLTPFITAVFALGLLVIPLLHILGAVHTYLRG